MMKLFFLKKRPANELLLRILFLASALFVWQTAGACAAAWAGSAAQNHHVAAADGHAGAQLRVVGGSTLLPIVQGVADVYRDHAGTSIISQGGGSTFGLSSVRDKTADVGMVGRNLTPEEKEAFGHGVIGHDAVAVIVNSHNPRQGVSREELRDIYAGRTTTWPQGLEGQADIVLISKRVGRGTLTVFEAYTGLFSPFHVQASANKQDAISSIAWEAGANLDSILWVGGMRGAIGFVSVNDAQRFMELGMPIRVLEVDKTFPTSELVASGEYPLSRELNLVYLRGNFRAEAFVRFMLAASGQAEVLEQGFIPALPSGGLNEVRP